MDLTLQLRLASVAGKSGDIGQDTPLSRSSMHLDDIRIMLQMSHDLGVLTGPAYGELSEFTIMVGAQIGGLLKFRNARSADQTQP